MMLYYLILTQVCGLNCLYCQNRPDPSIQPIDLSYDLRLLKKFIRQDPEPTIVFYGGDPLMRVDLVEEVMDEIEAEHFIIQTNALNLDRLGGRYLRMINTLIVSIDGRREVTDYYRGRGTYDRVLRNVRSALARGFKGDLVARMVASGRTDIFFDAKHLLELREPRFTHVHWQLDALWDYPPAQRYSDFDAWLRDSYLPGVEALVRLWVERILTEGVVPGIAPFKGIVWSMLSGEWMGYLRCGSGLDAFAMTTDGRILACPIAPEFRFNVVGHIGNTTPDKIRYSVRVGPPCTECSYYDLCGGRCLFANKTMLWGGEGFRKVCETVKHLIDCLSRAKEVVRDAVNRGVIDYEDIRYPPYLNSIEVIP